jgi:hypothetical protein
MQGDGTLGPRCFEPSEFIPGENDVCTIDGIEEHFAEGTASIDAEP